MKQYKYSLDKSSKKFICPKCHRKTFVKYIENETGNYANEIFGRCDRETKCNYHYKPTGESESTFETTFIPKPKPKPNFYDYSLVLQSKCNYEHNNFIKFLKTIFSDFEIKQAIEKYHIGTSRHWNGATVFWQIDALQRVRHGKILQYDCKTGKRYKDKNRKPLIQSVRAVLQLKNFNLCQCLFGLHLIDNSFCKTIAIVESEKTAIIMSLFKPEYLWLATGGKGFLKNDMLQPIKRCNIVAFPDKGEHKDWFNKSTELNLIGYKIEVNDWLENSNYEIGTDLADVYIGLITT